MSKSQSSTPSGLRGPEVRICLGLAAAVVLVYGQVLGHQFMSFDDGSYVVDNPWVREGLSFASISWAFSEFYSQNWHPLTWISHMLDVQIFGLNAGAHLCVNVVIHASSSILLFLGLRAMTGALWPSAIVAALFALHPLRVESVAWVSERKDVLGGFFFMLTLLAYARYTLAPTLGRYAAVFASLALGLMSKPMLVTLPPLLLLLDFWPLGRAGLAPEAPEREALAAPGWTRLILEKLPLFALVAASSLITLAAQGSVVSSFEALPLSMRIANAAISYVAYLWSAIWPLHLAFFYPHPAVHFEAVEGELLVRAVLASVLLAAVTANVLMSLRRRPYLTVGWLWYLGMLVPVIGLLQVGVQARADRYTYLPMIGIAVAVVWGVRDLVDSQRVSRDVVRIGVLALLGGLAALSWIQVATWRDAGTVHAHAVRVTTGNYVAHNGLGLVLEQQGYLSEAKEQYEAALAAYPGYADAHTNLGNAYMRAGDLVRAEQQQRLAIEANPELADGYNNLGVVLEKQGRSGEAAVAFDRALTIDPGSASAYYNLGVLHERQDRAEKAMESYRSAIALNPYYTDALCNLGIMLGKQGLLDEAQVQLHKAVASDPTHTKSRFNYAVVMARRGDALGAIDQLEQLLVIDPNNRPARSALEKLRSLVEAG